MSLSVDEGKFVSIVGPSGCGKSTLLNIIAGIETYDTGSVKVFPRAGATDHEPGAGHVLQRATDHEPRVGYVFQSPRLLNWLTVQGNLEFVLEAQGVPRELWQERVTKHL